MVGDQNLRRSLVRQQNDMRALKRAISNFRARSRRVVELQGKECNKKKRRLYLLLLPLQSSFVASHLCSHDAVIVLSNKISGSVTRLTAATVRVSVRTVRWNHRNDSCCLLLTGMQ